MSPASPAEIRETEQQLVSRAQESVSQCNWTVGECAAIWTCKYARGRTDADFAAMVGLSADQIYQRRRVCETFSDVRGEYPALKWSHFYVAINWDDAPECLQWAQENEATVAEMKAWRRARHGEDLAAPAAEDEWGGDPAIAFVPTAATEVRDPEEFARGAATNSNRGGGERTSADTLAAVAREAGAESEEPSGAPVATTEKPRPSAEQVVLRMISQLERIDQVLTPEFRKDFRKLPGKVRGRFAKAVESLSAKLADLA